MKWMFVLLSVVVLAGCDRKTSMANLECHVFDNWREPHVGVMTGAETKYNNIQVAVRTFDDRATITADGESADFAKVSEDRDGGDFGRVYIRYAGVFPGTNRQAELSVYGDISNRVILLYNLSFMDERVVRNGREFGVGHACVPVDKKYKGTEWSANVPFRHHYKMPNKIERCINEIEYRVSCADDGCTALYIYVPDNDPVHIILGRDDAMSITPNWDYSNMKLYQNDGVIQDHEKDACDVLKRLDDFIRSKGLDTHE